MPETAFKTPLKPPKEEEQEVPTGFAIVGPDENTTCPLLEETKKKKDFWLIKVPDNFDASCLSGQTIVLNGAQDIPYKENKERFEMISKPLSTSTTNSSLKVLIPSSSGETSWSAKKFKGTMSVVKSISVPTHDTDLQPEDRRDVEAPEIRCRWKPFGHKQPFKAQTMKQNEDEIKIEDQSREPQNRETKDATSDKLKIKVEKESPQKAENLQKYGAKEDIAVKVKEEGATPRKKRKKGK